MNIVVTGENGRLGNDLVKRYGCTPFGWMSTNESAIRRRIYELGHPDVIIHCAAITDVDRCENDLFDDALMTNWYLARVLRRMYSGRIIYISTDYVFDGEHGPYSEDAVPNPINHYGYTKMYGEVATVSGGKSDNCIVRTTQLFGSGDDFVDRIVDGLGNGREEYYSSRLYGSPTFIPDLSTALMELAGMKSVPEVINVAGNRVISRYDFAKKVANELESNINLIRLNSDVVLGDARRPQFAGLIVEKAKKLGLTIRDPLLGIEEMYS